MEVIYSNWETESEVDMDRWKTQTSQHNTEGEEQR